MKISHCPAPLKYFRFGEVTSVSRASSHLADESTRGEHDTGDAAEVCWNFPEVRVLGDGERAPLRAGLRQRPGEETRGEDAVVPSREGTIEPVDRVRGGGQVSSVQQVQTLCGEGASDLKEPLGGSWIVVEELTRANLTRDSMNYNDNRRTRDRQRGVNQKKKD